MVKKRSDTFSDSLGGGKERQGMLFEIHEPALVLSDAAQRLLFNPDTQWSMHFGTVPSIGLGESMRRRAAGDDEVPVHDVKLLIALPLHTRQEVAERVVKELLPDAGENAKSMVVVRQDRLVAKPRAARGDEAAWGKRDKREQWVDGVSIEITDPSLVARMMDAARQAPKQFKISTQYAQDWFEGTPPVPNGHLRKVLADSGVELDIFKVMKFSQDSSFSHEAGLKSYLESRSPAASRRFNP